MLVVLHQDVWAFINREVLIAIDLSNPIEVSPIPPSQHDPRASTGNLQITLSEADAEQIEDGLLHLFCAQGLQPDSEPNAFGRYIEHLMDIFHDACFSR